MATNGKHNICHVYYDNLVLKPEQEIHKICKYLGKEPNHSLADVIKRETRDKNSMPKHSYIKNLLKNNLKDKSIYNKLLELSQIYQNKIA